MNFTVTQNGLPLNKDLYTWNEVTRTFSTNESDLLIDFAGIDNITFHTGSGCHFITGDYCEFYTGSGCHFITGDYCAINFDGSLDSPIGMFGDAIICVTVRREIVEENNQ